MHKLNKDEFMRKVINDLYKKKLQEREKSNAADIHSIENCYKTRKFKGR